jgi:hypothetical protein
MTATKSAKSLRYRKGKRTVKNSALSPKALQLQARRQKAVRLRLIGHTFEEIGEALGVDGSTAFRDVSDARAEMIREPVMALLDQELDRLDALLAGCFEKAAQGNLAAIETALSVLSKRHHLLGMGKTKSESDITSGGQPLPANTAPPTLVLNFGPRREANERPEGKSEPDVDTGKANK